MIMMIINVQSKSYFLSRYVKDIE